MKRVVVAALAACLLGGCVSVRSVSLTQVPEKSARKKVVTAQAEKFMFLFIAFDNDYAEQVTEDLMEKCQGGRVQGILTKDTLTNYFLGFFTKRIVHAKGYCVKGATT